MYSQNYHTHKMSALRTMANNVTALVERLTRLKDEMRSGYILQFFFCDKTSSVCKLMKSYWTGTVNTACL